MRSRSKTASSCNPTKPQEVENSLSCAREDPDSTKLEKKIEIEVIVVSTVVKAEV